MNLYLIYHRILHDCQLPTTTILLLTQKVSRRVTSDCKIVAIFTTLSREYLLLNCECRVPGEYSKDNKLHCQLFYSCHIFQLLLVLQYKFLAAKEQLYIEVLMFVCLSVCPQVEILFHSKLVKLNKVQGRFRECSGNAQGMFREGLCAC